MNDRRSLFLIAAVFFVFALSAPAQDAISVASADLMQRVNHRVPPAYPPIAKAAHIQGTVVFEIRVGVSGNIESMRVMSGPAMLQQAATDCLKQWTFKPFEKNGAPVTAVGNVSIVFMLSDYHPGAQDEQIAERYFPLFDQCVKGMRTRQEVAKVAQTCSEAAKTAEQFGPGVRFIEKRSSFVYAATANANARDLKSALDWAEKAVAEVKLGHDDNSGSAAAYSTKGTVEGMMGDLNSADQDLETAEDFERKGMAWAEKEASGIERTEYIQPLIRDLRFHAQVLQALNRKQEAQGKLEEAAKLD